jgi:UDP-galactopyranose mutase
MKAVIVGAGLSGLTFGILLKEKGYDVEIFECRDHIGGHCHDEKVGDVIVQQYGPHSFHTDNEDIWNFVNRYSEFHPHHYQVMAQTSLGLIPIPFNKKSAEIVGDLSSEEIRDLIFVDYSEKQWGVPWEQIPETITKRVPTKRDNYNFDYHKEKFQGIPKYGYHQMFNAMAEGLTIHCGCTQDEWRNQKCDLLIYTGKLDAYFNYELGAMEYRSLRFEHKEEPKRKYAVIHECNKKPYTRSYDHSHWTDLNVEKTIVTYEYPCEYDGTNDPFYPKLFGLSVDIAKKYRQAAKKEKNVIFAGRLAAYAYMDMHVAIGNVMREIERL